MDTQMTQGAHVWVFSGQKWLPATVTQVAGGMITLETSYGEVITEAVVDCNRNKLTQMHSSSVDGVDDMATLGDLHEASILYNLKIRYISNHIYTYVGSILVSVNPYKSIPGLYASDLIGLYQKMRLSDLPPHVFAVANEMYCCLIENRRSQCAIVSGESGAGKTETTKHILNYLTSISHKIHDDSSLTKGKVERVLVESSPILEAFGNAKTVHNNNSSRFGKFILINFDESGSIVGGKITDYLLEKNRIVRQNAGERNYHIFYNLLAGLNDDEKQALHLKDASQFHYLNQSGCIKDDTIDDLESYKDVMSAMQVMSFKEDEINDILQLLAGILLIGNTTFMTSGGAQIEDESVVWQVAELLGLDPYEFTIALTQKQMYLRGEQISTPLDVQQAEDSRDSMAMSIYRHCFRYIISRINSRIVSEGDHKSIGVLDIFGFENFKVNRFEQFNINYANEKLQSFFNKHIFSLEQYEYNREGIEWSDINWIDNSECLDLIERKMGIIALIDEESRFPKGTDETLLSKLYSTHSGNRYFIKPKVNQAKFGVKHYAGDIFYDIEKFLEKSRDTFRSDVLTLLQNSSFDFIYDLFEHVTSSNADSKGVSSNRPRKTATVAIQFRDSLLSLMDTLNKANPFFIRCIKPNPDKISDHFVPDLVEDQLRYSGMLQTVQIRRAGYPVRRTFEEFIQRFHALLVGDDVPSKTSEKCEHLLGIFDPSHNNWQIGKTKVFLKEQLGLDLEKYRIDKLNKVATLLSSNIRGYLVRRWYQRVRSSATKVQAQLRAYKCRKTFKNMVRAAVTIQKYEKGRKARLVFQELLYIKKLEEEKKREEERLAAERKRKELERLEQEKMLKEFEELKQKMEEEERLKKEQEERERQRLEEEIMMELQRIKEREEARKAEMLAKKKIEEAERKKQEEKERQLAEEEERKKQELKKELTLESILQGDGDLYSSISDRFESEELSDEEESEYDEISIKESVSEYLGYEGYLSMKAGMMNNWKRRWGVLTSDNLMWFRSKQTVLKSGWLTIRNGPAATVSKKQPRSRWFVLKDNVLKYKESDQDGARTVGKIEIKSITKLERDPTSDNSLIVTTKGSKAHYFSADSHEDCSQWLASLHSVMAADASEVRKVADETSYFKSALDALDMDEISSVYPHSIASKPGSFAIITTERIYNFVADTPQIMEEWVLNIQKVKESYQTEHTGSGSEGKGWLYRENPTQGTKKKCWAILTSNGMEFYKNPEKEKLRVQSLVFNSLCSVYGPEEKMSGDNVLWTFTVYVRRQVHYFFTKFQEDSMAWVNSIQRVIDNKPRLIMPTERLISKIRTIHSHNLFCYFIKIFQDSNDVEIEDIYRSNPILNYSNTSIKAPLLALPYGKTVGANDKKKRGYGTISEEAVKTFNSLLTSETVGDYLALIQSQLQKFHDLPELRDEIYCQVIKQTNISNNPDSIGNLRYWQFLACLCCTRAPSRKYLYYLKFYLQRSLKRFPNTEAAKFMEFCLTACTKTKPREYPPGKEEIIAILGRRPILTYIYTYGNSSVKALVDSSIIADEVVQRLRLGLGLSNTKNCYALFEKCGTIYRAIDGRTVMTDILAKFEIYRTRGIGEGTNRWQIFFKPYCFIDLKSISCIAEEFLMFEEARESVVNGHFLNSEPTLVRLAALYQQFNHGDYFAGAWISNLEEIYPIKKSVDVSIKMEDPLSKLKSSHGFGSLGASFRKQSKIVKPEENVNINFQEMTEDEKSAIKSSIVEKWKQLKGMTEDTALEQYMDIIRTWPGSSATIFDVKVISGGFAVTKVWLAIGYENITIYKRGESVALSTMDYNGITWSGIESNSNYKIIIDKTKSIIFETNQVAEIAKLIKVCHEMRRKRISQVI
ncbi:Unconventional myosin-X [Trichoplax sp. H2]|nr:Unconventional myosin-X [Trichoplax sp. H2]|eukprot:RDD42798.1 Unconventional myosin-X [Trichoplax sp. H2]